MSASMMPVLANLLVGTVAVLHLLFLVLEISPETVQSIRGIDGVLSVRHLQQKS